MRFGLVRSLLLCWWAVVKTSAQATGVRFIDAGGNDEDVDLIQGFTRAFFFNDTISGVPAEFNPGTFKDHRSADPRAVGVEQIYNYTLEEFESMEQVNVTLGFAENYQPNCRVGKRVFDVTVNGESFADNLDIFDEVGCFTALVISETFTATADGKIVIQFAPSDTDSNPLISILQLTSATTPTPQASSTMVPVNAATSMPQATPIDSPSPTDTPNTTEAPVFVATPTDNPVVTPTDVPVVAPTDAPSTTPSEVPTTTPTDAPVVDPTEAPVVVPTDSPTDTPILTPTDAPVEATTDMPIVTPTDVPVVAPTDAPSTTPTEAPITTPTDGPVADPTEAPIAVPTDSPAVAPTDAPISTPTDSPVKATTDMPQPMPMATSLVSPVAAPQTGDLFIDTGGNVEDLGLVQGFTRAFFFNDTISGVPAEFDPAAFKDHRSVDPDVMGIEMAFNYSLTGFAAMQEVNITLGFAENFEPNCLVGGRVFDVKVNGESFVDDLDIFDEVGCFAALVISKPFTATADGKFVVQFVASDVISNPMVSILQILGTTSSTTAPINAVTSTPQASPTDAPVAPTDAPSSGPSMTSSTVPSSGPSDSPSASPSTSSPVLSLSVGPSAVPTSGPSLSPFLVHSSGPSTTPSSVPSSGTNGSPSFSPSTSPSVGPSSSPVSILSVGPSTVPTSGTSLSPSLVHSAEPSMSSSNTPTSSQSGSPSSGPSNTSSVGPSSTPSSTPVSSPSVGPSIVADPAPSTARPSGPSMTSSGVPSSGPSVFSISDPSAFPSIGPSPVPIISSMSPTLKTVKPSTEPTKNKKGGSEKSESPIASPTTMPSELARDVGPLTGVPTTTIPVSTSTMRPTFGESMLNTPPPSALASDIFSEPPESRMPTTQVIDAAFLVDATTGETLAELKRGMSYDLDALGNLLTVRLDTIGDSAGHVRFQWVQDGGITTHIDRNAPFVMAGKEAPQLFVPVPYLATEGLKMLSVEVYHQQNYVLERKVFFFDMTSGGSVLEDSVEDNGLDNPTGERPGKLWEWFLDLITPPYFGNDEEDDVKE